jgi:hypothetical protein
MSDRIERGATDGQLSKTPRGFAWHSDAAVRVATPLRGAHRIQRHLGESLWCSCK